MADVDDPPDYSTAPPPSYDATGSEKPEPSVPPASGGGKGAFVQKLSELKMAKDAGLLSDDEFFAMKKEIMAKFLGMSIGGDAKEKKKQNKPASSSNTAGWMEGWKNKQPQGARQDQKGAYGWFEGQGWKSKWPLQYAAMKGDVSAIKSLCAGGVDPNVKMTDWYDSEPLGWAASFGELKSIIALIECGADPLRPPNTSGNTPLKDAQRENHQTTIAFLQEYAKQNSKADPASAEGHVSYPIILVPHGDARQCKLANFSALRSGKTESMDLSSHSGLALVPEWSRHRVYQEWQYIGLHAASSSAVKPLTMRYEDQFLVRSSDGKVVDVAFWEYHEGNTLSILDSKLGRKNTRAKGGGRSFIINNDGTVACLKAKHLVLGVGFPKVKLVPKASSDKLILDTAAVSALKSERKPVHMKLAHPSGMAIGGAWKDHKSAGEWRYTDLAVVPAMYASQVQREGSHFVRVGYAGDGKDAAVFDVSMWKMNEGNHMVFVKGPNKRKTRIGGASHEGRSFVVNPDGSMSPTAAKHLCFGLK